MKKDPLHKKIDSYVDIDYSFDEISSKINLDSKSHINEKKSVFNRKKLIPILSFSFASIIIFTVSLSILNNLNNNNNPPFNPVPSTSEDISSFKEENSLNSETNSINDNNTNQEPGETGNQGENGIIKYDWEIIYKQEDNDDEEVSLIPPWEEKNIMQKYGSFTYDNIRYSSFNNILCLETDSIYIGEKIADIEVEGYDIYEAENHYTNAEIYEVLKVNKSCALAIKFEGIDKYYTYSNTAYEFSSLSEFINLLNLEEYLIFNKAHYYYFDENNYHTIEFDDFSDDYVWDNLLDNVSINNAYLNDKSTYKNDLFSISSSIPALGIENVSLALNDLGYIQSNILGSAKTFYIGENKMNYFINYIIKNVKGYEIIYVDDLSSIRE